MAESLKIEMVIDKDVIIGTLALGGELSNDNLTKDELKTWLKSHDSVEVDSRDLGDLAEVNFALAAFAVAGIVKALEKEKSEIKDKEK